MKEKFKNYLVYIICIILLIIDFISKRIVISNLELGKSIKVIKNFFYLTYTRNTGAAFSILEDSQILLIIITVIILFFINKNLNRSKLSKTETISFGLILGGILGNLYDRIAYKYVIDFLDFKIFGYNYPIFNLADTFIVIGVFILLIKYIKEDIHERNNSKRK